MSRWLMVLSSAGVLAAMALGGYNLYEGQGRITEIQNLTTEVQDLKGQIGKLKSQPRETQQKEPIKKR